MGKMKIRVTTKMLKVINDWRTNDMIVYRPIFHTKQTVDDKNSVDWKVRRYEHE